MKFRGLEEQPYFFRTIYMIFERFDTDSVVGINLQVLKDDSKLDEGNKAKLVSEIAASVNRFQNTHFHS